MALNVTLAWETEEASEAVASSSSVGAERDGDERSGRTPGIVACKCCSASDMTRSCGSKSSSRSAEFTP